MLTFGSLFAGIGGFDLGLESSGAKCVFQVERDKDCNRILERHWPQVERFKDVCEFNAASVSVRPDLICGGFPCQDLSVAGKRAGLAGERSGLWFEFKRIIGEFSPRWVLIENVPGLLSSNGGRDFGVLLGGLAELGYGFAYRILDAQWFGVPQRRRRVFIVGCLGDWRRAAEILFERDSLPWDSPPSRETGAGVAGTIAGGAGTARTGNGNEDSLMIPATKWWDGLDTAPCLDSSVVGKQQMMPEKGRFACVITDGEKSSSPPNAGNANAAESRSAISAESTTPTATAPDPIKTTSTNTGNGMERLKLGSKMSIRRLTPRECERLQGFPDDWTRFDAVGKELSDSARYRMLGNAVSVPVAAWLARRIVEQCK